MLQFEKSYELRGSDFDCHNHLRPSSVLDLFQEVAGRHAEELGVGFFDLIQRQMIWVVTKIRYEVVGDVRRNESVLVRTWPMKPSRVNFRREYLILGEDGRELIRGTSEWVIAHSEKRRVLPAKNIFPEDGDYCQVQLFEGRLRHVKRFEAEEKGRIVVPSFSQLDLNGHVSNIRYAGYVMDALRPDADMELRAFQIDYHRELLLDVPVEVQIQRGEDGVILAQGLSDSGEYMFCCEMETK